MGTTALRQLLKSLSESSHWKYALFWKLKHESPMLLTWEDGYCNYPEPGESSKTASSGIYLNGGCDIMHSNCEISICHDTSGGYPVELAVADMSCLQYTLGEGVIGEVALTGKHCWISSEIIFAGESEYPNEWLLQFASGIKTVLLVPVLPHGVLQLGSLEMVVEDASVVTHLQDRFNMLQNDIWDAFHFALNVDFQSQFSPLSSALSSTNILASTQEIKTIDDVKPNKTELLSPFGVGPVERVKYKPEVPEGNAYHQSIHGSPEAVDSELFAMSCLEDLHAFSPFNFSATSSNIIMNAYADERLDEPPFADMDLNIIDYENLSTFLSFPMDCELHKALGPALQTQKNEYIWDALTSSICNKNLINGTYLEDSNPYNILEATVDNASSSLNFSSSKSPESVKPHSSQPQCQSDAAYWEESVPQSAFTSFTASPSLESMISTLINDKSSREVPPRKSAKQSNASKRRVRSIDNPKPRPRDRQMIQDRVKELRDLVPDGSKCSIDGLLDKAVKHMLFLRNVTDRAEKLKQHEVTEPGRSHETNNPYQNGTSWGLEFDSESQICPIVVEDLENSGHMLIEMLCDDLGVFLEISQVIRGLELTILKGSLQTRSNNSWAHFIVEASKGFHRTDIFWPLMQFLQHKRKSISSKI